VGSGCWPEDCPHHPCLGGAISAVLFRMVVNGANQNKTTNSYVFVIAMYVILKRPLPERYRMRGVFCRPRTR